jgi:hypothetical protein
MSDTTRILMLIAVLATSTSPAVPLDFEILFIKLDLINFLMINYCYSNCGSMNTSFTFGRRNTLYAMAARFGVEL